MKRKAAEILIQHRFVLMLLNLICIGLLGTGIEHLRFNSDYKIFFAADNPQLLAFESIESTYTETDNIVYIIAAKNDEIFTNDNLDSIQQLTEESWQLDYALRVDSVTNYQHTYSEGDDLVVEDLVETPSSLNAEQLQELKKIAIEDPTLVNNIISSRGHVSLVSVTLELPDDLDNLNQAARETVTVAREIRDRYEATNPNLKIYLYGVTAVNNTFNELSVSGIKTLMPIMLVVVFGLLMFLLQSITGTFCTLVIIAAGVASTMGIAGYLGYEINQVNVSTPLIVMTIGVCDCVHILNNYLFHIGRGSSRLESMDLSLRTNIYPLFLTSLTTAIGFLGMNFSESPPFRELGNMAAIGIAITFILSVSLFPGLVVLLPAKKVDRTSITTAFFDGLCDLVADHKRKILYGGIALSLAIIACMFRNDLNDSTISYFSKNIPLRQAAEFTEANLTGTDQIFYSIDSGKTDGINDPEFLRKLEEFSRWYASQPEVVYVSTYTDIVKRLNQNLHHDDPAWYKLPATQALAAQYLLLFEMSLPDGLSLDNMINNDNSAVRFSVRLANVKAKQIIAVERRAQEWLQTNYPEISSTGSSVSLMFAHIAQSNIYSMMKGSLLALALVSITLFFALRSIRYGLISILPNSFPAAIAIGLWGIFSAEVNMAVSVIFTITLGIIVDDTVHFLTKYIGARRRKGFSPEQAIRHSFTIVGKALVTTTVVLSSGFFVMALSDFNVNADMGLMVGITILIALSFDLLILPALILIVEENKRLDS